MDWIAMILSVTGIVLNAKKKMLCWPIWILSNICWFIFFVGSEQYPVLILNVVFALFNLYGWYQWSKQNEISKT